MLAHRPADAAAGQAVGWVVTRPATSGAN